MEECSQVGKFGRLKLKTPNGVLIYKMELEGEGWPLAVGKGKVLLVR